MKKYCVCFLLTFSVLFLALVSSCKKDQNLNDVTVYLWKRELFSSVPANPLNGISPVESHYTYSGSYLVSIDYVHLTHAQVKESEENKRRDGSMFYYRYTKV